MVDWVVLENFGEGVDMSLGGGRSLTFFLNSWEKFLFSNVGLFLGLSDSIWRRGVVFFLR